MQIDRYTKVVLTVIAACLLYSTLSDLTTVETAMADAPTPVTIQGAVKIDWSGSLLANDPLKSMTSIPVKVVSIPAK